MLLNSDDLQILIDLIDLKLCCFMVTDRDDAKELKKMTECKNKLLKLFDYFVNEPQGLNKSKALKANTQLMEHLMDSEKTTKNTKIKTLKEANIKAGLFDEKDVFVNLIGKNYGYK